MPGAEVILYFDAQNKSHAVRLRPDNQTRTGEKLQLYFDPEKLHVFDKETGEKVILYFDAQNKSHAVRLRPDNQTRTGEKLQLYFDPEKLHVFDKETGENLFYREEISL